jgi:DNA repair exonuclease SbcCD ATPase subunit
LERLDRARDNAAAASRSLKEALIKHQTAVRILSSDMERAGDLKTLTDEIGVKLNGLKVLRDARVCAEEKQKAIGIYLYAMLDMKHLDTEREEKIKEVDTASQELERLNTQIVKVKEEEEVAKAYLDKVIAVSKRDADLYDEQMEIEKKLALAQAERVAANNKSQELTDEMERILDVTSKNQCPISGIGLPPKCFTAIDKMKGTYLDKADNLCAIATKIDEQISRDKAALKLISGTRLSLCVNVPWAERDLAQKQAQVHSLGKDIDRANETIDKAINRLAIIDGLILPLEAKIRAIKAVYPECREWTNDTFQRITNDITNIVGDIARTETQIQSHKDWLIVAKERKEQKEKEEQTITEVSKQLSIGQYWEDGFPRLKFYLMEEIIGRLESFVNTYLQEMMPGCVVALRTQREAKSREGMIDGLDIQWQNRQGFWSRLTTASEGQARRIALSFFAGLHSLICEGAGDKLGFLLLDEITENLDAEGQRMLVDMLDRYYSNKQRFVISHDVNLISLFPHNIEVIIDSSGVSHIQEGATSE